MFIAIESKYFLTVNFDILHILGWSNLEIFQGLVIGKQILVFNYEIGQLLKFYALFASSDGILLLVVDVDEQLDEGQCLTGIPIIVV